MNDLAGEADRREHALDAVGLARLVAQARDLVYRMSLPDGRYEYVNPAALEVTGYAPQEFYARPLLVRDLIPADWQDYFAEQWSRLVAGQEPEAYEFPIRHRSGEVRWVHQRSTLIRDDAGQPRAIEGVVTDITVRKRAEEARRALSELAEATFEAMAISKDGRLVESNSRFTEVFATTAAEALGRELTEFVAPECRSAVRRQLIDGAGGAVEHTARRGDGTRFPVELQVRSMTYKGEAVRITAWRDVTDRRQLEEQVRQSLRLESIGQLAAGVAHDFNNLLTVIQGSAALLSSPGSDPAHHATLLKQILTATERAANLTRQLLLFGRRQPLRPGPVNLNELTSNLSRILGPLLGERITLEFSADVSLPLIWGDASLIEQAIMNLVVNARDAMPQGGALTLTTRRVEVRPEDAAAHPESRPGRYAQLAIRDTGTGIPPEIRRHLFEPFFTTKPVGKGTGLGLATVYGIVKQHGGWIELSSGAEPGTTFRIHWPAPDEPLVAAPPGLGELSPPWSAQQVLVVEDEPAVRDLVCGILRDAGYRILASDSGAAALERPARELEQVDLLVTGVVVPGSLGGPELAASLRTRNPGLRVLFLGGYRPGHSAALAGNDVSTRFLPKPFTPEALVQAVRACFDASA